MAGRFSMSTTFVPGGACSSSRMPYAECAMPPNVTPMRLARWALVALALVAAVVLALRSLGKSDGTVGGAKEDLAAAELEQQAASARAATKPALNHAESLHVRVRVERPGMLRVQEGGPADTTLVPV